MTHLTLYKAAFLIRLVNLSLLISLLGCSIGSRSTKLYGKVTDDTQQPVANVQILVFLENSGTLGKGDIYQTLTTDKQGLYSTTVVPSKEYSGIQVINQFFKDPALAAKYRGKEIYYNGQRITQCCRVTIGETAEYNFILAPK